MCLSSTYTLNESSSSSSLALGIIAVAFGLQRFLLPFVSSAEQHALVLAAAKAE